MFRNTPPLNQLIQEIKNEPTPEIQWDVVEQQFLQTLAKEPPPRQSQPSFDWTLWGAAAAAALMVIGFGNVMNHSIANPTPSVEVNRVSVESVSFLDSNTKVRSLAHLSRGNVVETGETSETFSEPQIVSWRLEPYSRVLIRNAVRAREPHTIALEKGSLFASVTSKISSDAIVETFVVEVAGIRVAVHGTEFSVTLNDNDAIVDVEHGSVSVSPLSAGASAVGRILVGPARASFSLDGQQATYLPRKAIAAIALNSISKSLAQSEQEDAKQKRSVATAFSYQRKSVTDSAPHLDEDSSPEKLTQDTPNQDSALPSSPLRNAEDLRQILLHCFQESAMPVSVDAQITIASTLYLTVNAERKVASVRFNPPLRPELQSCGVRLFAEHVNGNEAALTIPIEYSPSTKK